jgi:hypothetical protein
MAPPLRLEAGPYDRDRNCEQPLADGSKTLPFNLRPPPRLRLSEWAPSENELVLRLPGHDFGL